jgi:toxin ParE1/3/4
MTSYRLSRRALGDLRSISGRIANDDPASAMRWLERIDDLLMLLTTQPEMGQRCDEVRPRLRRISAGNYVVYFEYVSDIVYIVRVVHGAQDIGKLF